MIVTVNTRAAFTSQGQVYLSWSVLLMFRYTVNSSLKTSVMLLFLHFLINITAGGCHVIQVRCCTGAERRVEVENAHTE